MPKTDYGDSRERILLLGGPGSGKTDQLVKVARYLELYEQTLYVIDMEDKMPAFLKGLNRQHGLDPSKPEAPDNIVLLVATEWAQMNVCLSTIAEKIPLNGWCAIDRIDLSWPQVQEWFTAQKYDDLTVADLMLQKNLAMKKSSMFTPMFDEGEWQVINRFHSMFMHKLLYGLRANVILTSGIAEPPKGKPGVFASDGTVSINPRGQKELGHQPNSAFLLEYKIEGTARSYQITTAKDLPGRAYFNNMPLDNFAISYIAKYYTLR